MYLNTGQEYDGSDSGARPDEAVSWGKIKADARAVKVRTEHRLSTGGTSSWPLRLTCCPLATQVYADATLVFPLLVAQTWGKAHWAAQGSGSSTS